MRSLIPGVLAMAIIVLASNILVQFLAGDFLTWGAFTYPFAFLVTDLVNRFQGTPAARKVVWAGFATGLACSIVGTQIQGEFGPLVTLRVAIASGAAFLVAQFLDIAVFNRFRGQTWWRAPFFATMAGSSLDTLTFFSIAFAWLASNCVCAFSIRLSTSPMPRMRCATRSGWKGSSASVFSPAPRNLIGRPVT